MQDRHEPWWVRFRVPMTVSPPLVGIAVAGPLSGTIGEAHPAIVAVALSTGIAAFAVQALFGTPGVRAMRSQSRSFPALNKSPRGSTRAKAPGPQY
jgi:hypothetical protein